jgi:putative Mn2+ efflux pump MntP
LKIVLIITSLILAGSIIGVVAFLILFAVVLLGMNLEDLLGKRIELPGGLILIAIGLNIIFSHVAVA